MLAEMFPTLLNTWVDLSDARFTPAAKSSDLRLQARRLGTEPRTGRITMLRMHTQRTYAGELLCISICSTRERGRTKQSYSKPAHPHDHIGQAKRRKGAADDDA